MSTTIKGWARSILAAAIGAVSNSIAVMVVDPIAFNFTKAGLTKVGEVALVSAIVAVAHVLQKSPLPGDNGVQ